MTTATVWDSIDAIRAFAGDQIERAVVEPVVHEFLDRCDDEVTHFTPAVAR